MTPPRCLSPQVIGGAINNDFIHLWPCAMLVAGLMLVFKCMSADQARNSVEWSIFVSGTQWRATCHGIVTVAVDSHAFQLLAVVDR